MITIDMPWADDDDLDIVRHGTLDRRIRREALIEIWNTRPISAGVRMFATELSAIHSRQRSFEVDVKRDLVNARSYADPCQKRRLLNQWSIKTEDIAEGINQLSN
ncbi:MAG: phospholipase D-like domain-containing protein [Acidimicrobiales bacterium]